MLAYLHLFALGLAPGRVFFDTQGRFERGVTPSSAADAVKLFAPVCDGKSLIACESASAPKPGLLSEADAEAMGGERIFLGRVDSSSPSTSLQPAEYWLLDCTATSDDPTEAPAGFEWMPLRARAGPSICDSLDCDEAALLATARGMSIWHQSIKFCSSCGSPDIELYRDGKGRRCSACGTRFRPRIDASVIVLVLDPSRERCLLGRKAEWPAGRYSTLAGFVEFGETLDECVVREILEESGVDVDRPSIEYVASQPWLFPRSLMVGFVAQAADGAAEVKVDENELEDAQWFDKDFVREQLSLERESGKDGPATEGGFHVPSKVSLARSLIEHWLEEE